MTDTSTTQTTAPATPAEPADPNIKTEAVIEANLPTVPPVTSEMEQLVTDLNTVLPKTVTSEQLGQILTWAAGQTEDKHMANLLELADRGGPQSLSALVQIVNQHGTIAAGTPSKPKSLVSQFIKTSMTQAAQVPNTGDVTVQVAATKMQTADNIIQQAKQTGQVPSLTELQTKLG